MNATNWIVFTLCVTAGFGALAHATWHEASNWRWIPCDWGNCRCDAWRVGCAKEFTPCCQAEWHNEWVEKRFYRRWTADLREWFKDARANWSGK